MYKQSPLPVYHLATCRLPVFNIDIVSINI